MEDVKEIKMNFLDKLIIFLTVLFKYLITYNISKTFLYGYLGIIIVLLFVDIFNKKFYNSEIKKIFILGLIACYFIFFYLEQNFLISFILAIVCLKRHDKDFIKQFFYSSIICFTITLLLSGLDILVQNDIIRIVNNESLLRYSLGFKHPNEVFLFFLPIVLSGFYLFSDKKFFYIFTIIFSTILYILSYCRTGFFVIIIFLIFVLFRKFFTKKLVKKIIPISFILLTLFSVCIAIFFGGTPDNKIAKILSKRPYYWNYYIDNGTILSIFGHNKAEGQFLDNFYIYILVQLGIVGYIIYFYIYYKTLKIMKDNYKYLIITSTFLIYGLFEANVIIGSIQFLFALQLKNFVENNKTREDII